VFLSIPLIKKIRFTTPILFWITLL